MWTKSSRAPACFFWLLVSYSASSVVCVSGVLTMRPRSPRHRRRGREVSPHRSCAQRVRRVRRIWKLRIQAARPRLRRRRAPPPRPTTGARPLHSRRSRRRRGATFAYLSARGCHSVISWSAGAPRGGVAGASSKLTLEIVCVRLAINDGGLGSVADILPASASARGPLPAVIQYFQCRNLGSARESGARRSCWVVATSQVRVENGRRLARYESFADKRPEL